MKHLVVGLGSIGRRHAANLRHLIPSTDSLVTVDSNPLVGAHQTSPDADYEGSAVYICTPTACHHDDIYRAVYGGAAAVFVEKPMMAVKDRVFGWKPSREMKFAVGYQYRYNTAIRQIKSLSCSVRLLVGAGDNLVDRYGPTALETMASHAIDYALWINGPVEKIETSDDGAEVFIGLRHKSGVESSIFCEIAAQNRYLNIHYRRGDTIAAVEIPSDNQMYIDEMIAWLHYLRTGDRGDLCSYDEALAVQEVMRGGQ